MNEKQDRSPIRTFEQLIRRYDLESIASIQRATENNTVELNKTNATMEQFVSATIGTLENMQSQIDGKISTWFYSGEPTLNNTPASEWKTDEEKASHLGDLYYDKDTGFAYRFSLVDGVYGWVESSDDGVAEALAIANAAKDTADGKRRVFTSIPSPPYDVGDLWFKDKEIYICNTAKPEGGEYESDDFGIATKYTGDDRANEVADDLAKNYTTTVDMNLTISKSASEILTTVAAAYTTKNEFTNEITTLEEQYTAISVKANGLETTVSSHTTKIDSLSTRVSSAESSITQHASQISLRVEKSGVISAINQTAETVKISAAKVELEGAVTFSALDSSTQTKINTASTNASNAVSTANTANTNATSALNRATYHYGTCATAAATAAKVVTLSNFSLYTGAMVSVYFTYANTAANPTLNVNSTGAKSIRVNNAALSTKYYWKANNTVTFVYNGTYWVMADSSANTLLASWCSDNDKTLIDGGKIYAKSIKAASIDVDNLFALDITIKGKFEAITDDGTALITMNKGGISTYGKSSGYKGIEITGSYLNVYAWNDSGDRVGYITSLKNDTYGKSIGLACESDNYIGIGMKSSNDTVKLALTINREKNNEIIAHTNFYIENAIAFRCNTSATTAVEGGKIFTPTSGSNLVIGAINCVMIGTYASVGANISPKMYVYSNKITTNVPITASSIKTTSGADLDTLTTKVGNIKLTTVTIPTTATANPYVSPYTHYEGITLASYVSKYGIPIRVSVIGASGIPMPCHLRTDNVVVLVSNTATPTIVATFMSGVTHATV